MLEFFMGGGYSMFIVALLSLVTIGAAVRFAIAPKERGIALVRALSAATAFSVAGGVAANLAAVGSKIPGTPEWAQDPNIHLLVMMGISESMAPAILGLSLVGMAWLGVAVGVVRLGASEG